MAVSVLTHPASSSLIVFFYNSPKLQLNETTQKKCIYLKKIAKKFVGRGGYQIGTKKKKKVL